MSGHTPTPWQAHGRFIYAAGSTDTYSGAVWGAIADAGNTVQNDAEGRTWTCAGSAEANAAFIVLACNSHGELVEALEDWDNWFCGFDPEDRASRMQGRQIIIRTRELVAKAKGEAL